ncbi:MAG: hypothetical protein J07HQW2_00049 [Haloquadratum walsbyi J07HQW2]|uniref:Uncharacterized protein n=1 Tax=Haloquadratum walsbyi J07HQW2 TaxID=1238425 RepID=U1PMZ5_9EURY|nr:MAG: hypothetical protein J07HQW2_00049 [Haloquadratum walsbyi J07HQW2]
MNGVALALRHERHPVVVGFVFEANLDSLRNLRRERLEVVVGGRRDRLGEVVTMRPSDEHRDIVPSGVGRQPSEGSGLKGFRVGLAGGIVGAGRLQSR